MKYVLTDKGTYDLIIARHYLDLYHRYGIRHGNPATLLRRCNKAFGTNLPLSQLGDMIAILTEAIARARQSGRIA